MKRLLVLSAFCLSMLCSNGIAEDSEQSPSEIWLNAETRIRQILSIQGRTADELESPMWFETPYMMRERMPMIDLALKDPLMLPEIALWIDRTASADSNFHDLIVLSERIAEADSNLTACREESMREYISEQSVDSEVANGLEPLPENLESVILMFYRGISAAAAHRDLAFDALSSTERQELKMLMPGYFIKTQPSTESVRGYTTEIGDCLDLIDILQKVDFRELILGSHIFAVAIDDAMELLKDIAEPIDIEKTIEIDSSIGRIVIAGKGSDLHVGDAMLSVDLGGDDHYTNHAGHTDIDSFGAAILLDLDGDDVYSSDGTAQASAFAGYAALLDLKGDDRYLSKHYSQGAALLGYAIFADLSGDDVYSGDFGVQGFALFGTTLFLEAAGRDTYRCAAMGQAAASTLGVSILIEQGGDDVYRSGGKYDFYFPWDSSCSQGAGSGMRAWPPQNKFSVYGGVGILLEKAGNDEYTAYNVGQGGSYMFATGILVESDGNDTYTSKNYCRGVGVHLSAAVALDLNGNDVHTGLYGQNGYSLDRSTGVFVDFNGDDIYRTTGGIGFGHKPRGTGIFLDVRGDDLYAGTENNYGKADVPFADDQFSSGFFMDWGGQDIYSRGPYANDTTWAEGEFGFGEDRSKPPEFEVTMEFWCESQSGSGIAGSDHPLVRNHLFGDLLGRFPDSLPDIERIAASDRWQDRDVLIDLLPYLRSVHAKDSGPVPRFSGLLESGDRNVLLSALLDLKEHPIPLDGDSELKLEKLTRESTFYEVRAAACDAYAECLSASDGALTVLSQTLQDSDWRVRRQAAISFGKLKNPQAFQFLRLAIVDDPAFQVRAHAVASAIKLNDPSAESVITAALGDASPLVRCIAARSLLIEKNRIEPFKTLVDLWDWDSRILRESWLLAFLSEFCGQSFSSREELESWWNAHRTKKQFDRNRAVYKLYQKVKIAKNAGNQDEMFEALDKIIRIRPDHVTARTELSQELNGAAWEMAVAGHDLKKARKMAERSVSLDSNSMNRDTLAVILFLHGDPWSASELLKSRREATDEAGEIEMIDSRLEEFKTGHIRLR